jgi:hypothetical protein
LSFPEKHHATGATRDTKAKEKSADFAEARRFSENSICENLRNLRMDFSSAFPSRDLRMLRDADRHYARSLTPVSPAWRAQFAQQNIFPPASTPWPMILQSQCAQAGASA